MLDDEEKALLRSGEVDALHLHFGFGAAMRNGWGLWHRSSLTRWFRMRGVWHAEDMSGIILESYIRRLRGEPQRVREQIAETKQYWKEVAVRQEAQREEDARREVILRQTLESRRLGWTQRTAMTDPQVPHVAIPDELPRGKLRKMERYRGGYLLFTSWPYRTEVPDRDERWFAELYWVEDGESSPRPVAHRHCPEVFDVVTLGPEERSHWLCREGSAWTLVSDDGEVSRLPFETGFLRFAAGGDELLLYDQLHVYARSSSGWTTLYEHTGGVSLGAEHWAYDHDAQAYRSWSFPLNGETPRLVGSELLFPKGWAGFGAVSLRDPTAPYQTFHERWGDQVVGRIMSYASHVIPSASGGAWIPFQTWDDLSGLLLVRDGSFALAVVQGALDRELSFGEGALRSPRLDDAGQAETLPGSHIYDDARTNEVFLVGREGLARVVDSQVDALARFELPPTVASNHHHRTFRVTKFGRFDDGAFIMEMESLLVLEPDPESGFSVRPLGEPTPVVVWFGGDGDGVESERESVDLRIPAGRSATHVGVGSYLLQTQMRSLPDATLSGVG